MSVLRTRPFTRNCTLAMVAGAVAPAVASMIRVAPMATIPPVRGEVIATVGEVPPAKVTARTAETVSSPLLSVAMAVRL